MENAGALNELTIPRENRLLKILGIGFGLSVVIGGAIGSGILRNPGIVAANLGVAWAILAAWMFGGVYSLLGANTYAEVSTALPIAGGPYVFIRRAYGDFPGFAGGMTDFVQNCCSLAYLSIVFGEYVGTLIPALAGRANAVAVAVLCVLSSLNMTGVRSGDLTQKITSGLKVVAFLAFVAACFIFGSRDSVAAQPIQPVTALSNPLLIIGGVAIALNSVMGTYSGWYAATFFCEECPDPGRYVPRSLFGGILMVTAIYLLVNAALLYALPVGNIAASKLPAADVATNLLGDAGGRVITALALCSVLGVINAGLMFAPRSLFSMSRDGFVPASASSVNRRGTPGVALAATLVLAVGFALSGTYETLLEISVFLVLCVDSAVYLAIFVLRRREPDLPRPFRAIGYPILPGIILVISWVLLAVFVVGNTKNSLFSIGILIMLYPVFILLKLLRRRMNGNSLST